MPAVAFRLSTELPSRTHYQHAKEPTDAYGMRIKFKRGGGNAKRGRALTVINKTRS